MNEYILLADVMWKLHEFEHNNECIINLRHGGNVHTNILYLECSFKNDNGRKQRINRYLDFAYMKWSCTDLRIVIDNELAELEMMINEHRNIKTVKFSQLIARANKQDWMGRCMIVKNSDGSTSIRCHDTPTYYGDGIEPDPDDFWSLYCVIENDVITDTFRMNDKYKDYKVILDV